MYAYKNNLRTINVQLTYFNIDDASIRSIKKELGYDEISTFFGSLITIYTQWIERVNDWTMLRKDSIDGLVFPFENLRIGQEKIISEVGYAVADRAQLLIEAPTGIGKTMAILFPVIQALGKAEFSRIFYCTARTTGRDAAETALNILRQKGLRIKSLSLIAKEKICPNPDRLCNGKECEFAAGYYDRIGNALKNAFENDEFSRDRIYELAIAHRVCPFEFSLELSLWCDFIICDYNYIFDPKVYLRRFFGEMTDDHCFLVDEAHNL